MDLFLIAQPDVETTTAYEEEPALEIALPQVFEQPIVTDVKRGQLPHPEWLVSRLYQTYATASQSPGAKPGLGPEYQTLVNEFQPLLSWGLRCWDFLQSTEGCRFVRRGHEEKFLCRGDYRAVTDKDYSRLLHRVFRQTILDFAQHAEGQSLGGYLRVQFWPKVTDAYRKLDEPSDPRQRHLTAYSYLRCAPYQFLNAFHHELVTRAIGGLPRQESRAIDTYFLHFYTLEATSDAMRLSPEAMRELVRRGLLSLLLHQRLAYCLLRQIERY